MTGVVDHTTKDAEVSTIMHTDTDTAIITTDVIPEPGEAEVAVKRDTGAINTKKTITNPVSYTHLDVYKRQI